MRLSARSSKTTPRFLWCVRPFAGQEATVAALDRMTTVLYATCLPCSGSEIGRHWQPLPIFELIPVEKAVRAFGGSIRIRGEVNQ